MPEHVPVTDPRSIVTPDAFEVSSALLGMPLASPRRRLAAILVDLAVIGLVTAVTSSFALVLGAVVAVLLVHASFRRTDVPRSVFGRAMRLSLGCLGLFVGVVTAVAFFIFSLGGTDDLVEGLGDAAVARVEQSQGGDARAGLGLLRGGIALARADTEEDARTAVARLVREGRRAELPDAEIRDAVAEFTPPERPWSDQVDRMVEEALAEAAPADDDPPADPGRAAPGDTSAVESSSPTDGDPAGDVAALSVPEALQAYATLLLASEPPVVDTAGTPPPDEAADARLLALRARLVQELAADTLAALEGEIAELDEVAADRLERIGQLGRELREAEGGGGLFGWLRGLLDELGFGFGWASLYMTVVLSAWKGRTVGKKLLGIRVVRLDGGPITWWTAFERAGGYAAGFATGLLGFAQVWWDANRQAIHDRIVGTVVVVDGAEPVGDWRNAT